MLEGRGEHVSDRKGSRPCLVSTWSRQNRLSGIMELVVRSSRAMAPLIPDGARCCTDGFDVAAAAAPAQRGLSVSVSSLDWCFIRGR